MEAHRFHYYPADIKKTKALGSLSINRFIEVHKNPSQKFIDTFKAIEKAEVDDNMTLKAELKQNNLYSFTPCVYVSRCRVYQDILSFTGLMVLDFDHLPSVEYSIEFKEFLFNEYQSVIGCWLSPSKHGVKALVNIPVVQTVGGFKEYYFGMCREVSQYKGFDDSGQNAVLPLFQSYDPDILHRENYQTWVGKGFKENNFIKAAKVDIPHLDITDKDKEVVVKTIKTGFNNIIDFGHPPLRSLCISVGGYVASGYIDEYEALSLIDALIDNHGYLNAKPSGYKKTARWAVGVGKTKPIIL